MQIGFSIKLAAILCTLVGSAAPALALDLEEIGMIQATFDGEPIVKPTVLVRDANEATAFLVFSGAGFSAFSMAGYSLDTKRLGIELTYRAEQPGLTIARWV